MADSFVTLMIILGIASITPFIARLIPRQMLPETVIFVLAGAILGPNMLNVIHSNLPTIHILSDLGCAFLFLLAGYEIEPAKLMDHDGKKGIRTWFVTFVLGIAFAAFMPHYADGIQGIIASGLLLTTTALGTLMPILKEREMMGKRTGDLVIAYGTWGELAAVLAMSILLSVRSTWKTAAIIFALFLLCAWIANLGNRAVQEGTRIYQFLEERAETTSQIMVRLTILILIILVTFSAIFDLDIVLGAFAAGFVLRIIMTEISQSLEAKLNGIGYGFLIPIFFVVSGSKINLYAISKYPSLLIFFILGLVLVRTLPIICSLSLEREPSKRIDLHQRVSVAFYCTTALPLIVAITGILVDGSIMDADIASVIVASGAITVFAMPLVGALTNSIVDSQPIDAVNEIIKHPKETREILRQHWEMERRQALREHTYTQLRRRSNYQRMLREQQRILEQMQGGPEEGSEKES